MDIVPELEEIEWVAGLTDKMPDHLVRLGTTSHTYTHQIILDKPPEARWITDDDPPDIAPPARYERLPQPITETRVWGTVVKRTTPPGDDT